MAYSDTAICNAHKRIFIRLLFIHPSLLIIVFYFPFLMTIKKSMSVICDDSYNFLIRFTNSHRL